MAQEMRLDPQVNERSGKSEEHSREAKNRQVQYGAVHILKICVPVCISMAAVVLALKAVPSYNESEAALLYTPFSEDVETTIHRTTNSVLNALLFVVVVITTTTILLLLYFYKFYRFLNSWMMLTTVSLLSFFTFMQLKEMLLSFNFPIDTITVAFCLWNFGIVGMLAIFWKAPIKLQQFYLIHISVVMTLTFVKHLPDWTGWMVLAALVLWDLIAVLSPKGPLRIFVETVKQRDDVVPPALVYVSAVYASPEPSSKNSSRMESQGVKLGLGDFIFYGLLVGKASKCQDWLITSSCFLTILVGLTITSFLLSVYKRTLPALPISITLGLFVYFTSTSFVQSFSATLITKQIFV